MTNVHGVRNILKIFANLGRGRDAHTHIHAGCECLMRVQRLLTMNI